jgi:hypothetical protein
MILFSSKTVATRLAILALGFGLAGGAATASPIAAGTDTAWHGNLTAGARFGTAVGGLAADLPATLWQQGSGFEGVAACSAETEALFGCRSGEVYMVFQPVELGRKGHVYFKVDGNRISQIGWDLKVVPTSDG